MKGKFLMIKFKKLTPIFNLWKNDFLPYFRKENDFYRVAIIHSVAAFIISPIFFVIVNLIEAPSIYKYISISYTLLFPVYLLICWRVSYLKSKLALFFIGHFFLITFIAFFSLIKNSFFSEELFMFSGLFVVGVLVIQRVYPLLLYIFSILLLFLYAFSEIKELENHTFIISFILLIIAVCAFFVLYIRVKTIKKIVNYSKYLQKIINSSGSAYILFDIKKENDVIDFTKEVSKIFNLKKPTNNEIKELIFSKISKKEIKLISKLLEGKEFIKHVKLDYLGVTQTVEFKINVFKIKNNHFWLLKINNITSNLIKIENLKESEKKYRHLYENNKAGVFTIDKNSVIINGNSAFFKMLDSLCSIGDKLFIEESQKDWKLIVESLGVNELTQNFQTQLKLSNGNEKTFIFNWYLDLTTNYIEGSVIDLTKNQKISLALKQSEEKYRLIYEETNDAILILEDDFIIDTNKKATQLFGLTQQNLLKMKLYDLTFNKNEDNRRNYTKIKEQNTNARSVKFDWIFDSNGKKIESEVVLIEVTLGKKMYYQCVIHDNTKNNQYIRSIEKTQQNITNILENHPDGIIISREEHILFSNPEITNIIGEKVSLNSTFKKRDQIKFEKIYTQHISDRERKNIQLVVLDINGVEVTMDVTLTSTIFEEKDAVLIILKDVSLKNKIEREKLRAEVAEESNKKLAKEIKERIYAEKQLEDQFLRINAIFESSSNTLLLTIKTDASISFYNSHCKEYFEKKLKMKIKHNESLYNYFDSILDGVQSRSFKKIIYNTKNGRSKQFEIDVSSKGKINWLEIFINPIYNTDGVVTEISIVAHDISEKKKITLEIESSLKEKEVLLKEIHHRVKNNLQVISSILNLQSSFIEDKKTLSILQESRNRVRTMAIIHENLYRTEDFSSINFSNYIDNLTGNLISSYRINEEINLVKTLQEVDLVLDQAIPCGLIVNEIITNSLKYAWKQNEKGSIFISLKEEKNVVCLEISDDGIGLPFDFNEAITDTLGLQLVTTLIEQLDGEVFVNSEKGTKYLIKFDKIKP